MSYTQKDLCEATGREGMIRIQINVPEQYRAKAVYAFEILALRWGIPIVFTNRNPHISYRYSNSGTITSGIYVPFNESLYHPQTVCYPFSTNGRVLWVAQESGQLIPDLVGATYRLLTYMDEMQVCDQDRAYMGSFITEALPAGRRESMAEPLVEHHAEIMLEEVLRTHPRLVEATIPRWPNRKRHAVALTHDVDAVNIAAPLELVTSLTKALLRRNVTDLRMFFLGLLFLARQKKNPLFKFLWWSDMERRIGARSAFYLFHRPMGIRPHLHDPKSSISGWSKDWDILRRMRREGWEFGLHPAINSGDHADSIGKSKAWLEQKLDGTVDGIRHHYFAIDWLHPYRTHYLHSRAGFLYDTSIGWRGRPGLRAATSLPYQPHDPERDVPISLTVLPLSLMDTQILQEDTHMGDLEQWPGMQPARDLVELIKRKEGMILLNWHQETAFNKLKYAYFMDALDAVLESCLSENEAWIALPREIVQHWSLRAKSILPSSANDQ